MLRLGDGIGARHEILPCFKSMAVRQAAASERHPAMSGTDDFSTKAVLTSSDKATGNQKCPEWTISVLKLY